MKRMILTSLVIVIALTTGCARTDAKMADSDKLQIVTSIFVPYDFARQIAGDKADITMLLPPAAESHSFEPTPQDIIRIQNSDLFIYNGGESEAWVDEVLASMDTSRMNIVRFIDCVEVVEEEIVEGMEEEVENEYEEEHAIDEHIWTSPRNAKLIVSRISDAICDADPAGAAFYKLNTDAFHEKLDDLDAKIQAVVNNATRKTLIFGDRFPFRYFVDAYGLDYFAAFPGCSVETEASAQTVAFLINKVKTEQIPVVFHIELSNPKMANTIAEDSGAKVLELHAGHNISKTDFESGKTYLDIMTANIYALEEALS